MSRKRSWVWLHFTRISEDSAACSVCEKIMTCTDGSTSGLRRHLKTHSIVQMIVEEVIEQGETELEQTDEFLDESSPSLEEDEKANRSWVWNYFTKISNSTAKCGVCEKVIRCQGPSTTGMAHHLSIHQLSEDDVERLDRSFDEELEDDIEDAQPETFKVSSSNQAYEDDSPKMKRSWVWNHFTKVSSLLAKCEICFKEISCKESSTSGMRTHLRMHNLTEINSQAALEERPEPPRLMTLKPKKTSSAKSWVWNYFEKMSNTASQCDICLKKIKCADSSTSGMRNHLKTHNLTEDVHNEGLRTGRGVRKSSVESPKKKVTENKFRESRSQQCHVCDEMIGAFGTPLDTSLEFTNVPINELLESFGLDEPTRNFSAICLDCLSSLKRYDEFQHHCQVIQKKITNMYHRTHSDTITIVKEEPETDDGEEMLDGNILIEDGQQIELDRSNSWTKTESTEFVVSSESKKQEAAPITRTNAVYQCDKCSKSFSVRSRMIRHLKSHGSGNKGLPCVNCSKICRSDFHLQTHMITEHLLLPDGPFECPTCSKVFNTKQQLKMHYYLHKPEKNWLCILCGQRFGHKSQFTMHMMIHNDLRPFVCEYEGCSKAFRTADKRKIHHRVHSGEKIYECPHCPGKRFAQLWGRDLHIRNFHKSDPKTGLSCNICGIRVQSKAKLKNHQVQVHERYNSDGDSNF